MRPVALVAVLALLSCSDPLGSLTDGQPYTLRSVNGESLPWALPPVSPTHRIAEGWVKIIGASRAERHERIEALDSLGTVQSVAEWTHAGSYRRGFGTFILTYEAWQFNQLGPRQPVDTFAVSENGLRLRETGFVPPLDSIVRYYAP
jgi:hypothetical protein